MPDQPYYAGVLDSVMGQHDGGPAPPPAPTGYYAPVLDAILNPGLAESPARQQAMRLERERASAAAEYTGPELFGLNRQDIYRHTVPFGGSVKQAGEAEDYKAALKAADDHEATDEQLRTIARYDQEQARVASQGVGGQIARGVASIPAIVGEAELGPARLLKAPPGASFLNQTVRAGASGPLLPSLVVPEAERRSIEQGGEATDLKNAAPAAGLAVLQNAILGTVARQAGRVPGGFVPRVVAGAGIGVVEQAGADVLAGTLDEVLPEAYRTKTKYGVVGDLVNSRTDDAMRKATVQAVTFAAFAALHGGDHAPLMKEHAAAADALAGRGFNRESAGRQLDAAAAPVVRATAAGESKADILARVEAMPDGPLKDYAQAFADALPDNYRQDKTAPEPAVGPPLPPPEGAQPINAQRGVRQPVTAEPPETAPGGPETAPGNAPAQPPAGPEIAPQAANAEAGGPVPVKARGEGGRYFRDDQNFYKVPENPAHLESEPAAAAAMRLLGNRAVEVGVGEAGGEPALKSPHLGVHRGIEQSPHAAMGPEELARLGLSEWLIHAADRNGRNYVTLGEAGHPEVFGIDYAEAWHPGTFRRPNGEVGPSHSDAYRRFADGPVSLSENLIREVVGKGPELERLAAAGTVRLGPEAQREAVGLVRQKIEFLKGRLGRPTTLSRLPTFEGMFPEEPLTNTPPPVSPPPPKADRLAAFKARGRENSALTPDQLGLKPAAAAKATRDAMVDAWEGWSLPAHEAELQLREVIGRLLDKGYTPLPDDARGAINALMEKAQLKPNLRHFLEQRLLDKTLQEIGDNWPFNKKKMLTRERIRQLEGQALDQLGIDRSVAAAVFAPEKAEGKQRLARKVKTPGGAVTEAEVPEKEGRRGKDALAKAQAEHDAAQDVLVKVLEKIKANGGTISAADQAVIDRALATGEREGQLSQGGPEAAPDEAARGGGRPPGRPADPQGAGEPVGAGPGLGQAGQGPIPLPAPAAGAKPVPAAASAGLKKTRLQRNLIPNGPGDTLDRAVLDAGGINPTGDAFKAFFSDAAEARQNKVPGAILRKTGMSIDEMAGHLQTEGHLPSGDAQDLVAALKERRESALHMDKGIAAAAEEHARQQHLAAVDEHASFLQEFEGLNRSDAETAAERWLAAQVRFNLERPLPDAMGAASRGFTPEAAGTLGRLLAEHVKASARQFVQGVQDFVGKLGGQIAPATSRFSEAAGNAVARLDSARHFARELTPFLLDRILPPGAGMADRLKLGAVMTEMRLRHMRVAFWSESQRASDAGVAAMRRATLGKTPQERAAAKADAKEQFRLANEFREKSEAVVSLVGGSFKDKTVQYPLPDEAAFRQLAADPAIRRQIEAYKEHAVPVMEKYFRKATGLAEGEGIESMTQIGDMPVSLVVRQEGEETPTTVFFGTARGKVGAHSLHRLGASREATGAAGRGYELDLGTILEKMAADRVPLGAKAEAFRTWEKEGVGRWGEPGDSINVDGVTWKKMPKVDPPKGSQAAEKGQTAFFVDPRFWGEVHQVLGVNEPPGKVPFSSLLSKLTLASTVEAAYHSRNLLTMLTRPGFNPVDVARHAYKLATKDPAAMKAVLDLAEIGAMKEHGFEAPVFLGKYNPLARFQKATGAFLSVVDRSVRLAAADAFDRVAKLDGVENTERAKRDFINQAGNYSKLTQSRIVAWLRDTGLGPFATAGSNFYVQGLRGLIGSHGIRTTSYKADLRLRAEMLLRMAVLPAVAAAVNYALWGRIDGDDKTPLFGLKVGTDEKGRTSYLDLGGLTGVTRGMRETGLQALAESQRPGAKKAGATPSDAFDRGVADAALAVLHPAIGPPVSLVHTALTGKNTLGGQVAPKADPKKGESQAERNLWAALWQTNPVLESYLEPVANRAAGFKEKREESGQERLMKMLGPFGVKTRGEAPGAPHRQVSVPVPASPQQKFELKARQAAAKTSGR